MLAEQLQSQLIAVTTVAGDDVFVPEVYHRPTGLVYRWYSNPRYATASGYEWYLRVDIPGLHEDIPLRVSYLTETVLINLARSHDFWKQFCHGHFVAFGWDPSKDLAERIATLEHHPELGWWIQPEAQAV